MIPTRFNNGYISRRPLVLSLSKLLLVGIAQLPLLRAAPTRFLPFVKPLEGDEDLPMSPAAPTLWIYLAVAVGLVLLGGAFAGLTIALMGQVRDSWYIWYALLITPSRTRYILKLSRRRGRAPRESTPPKS